MSHYYRLVLALLFLCTGYTQPNAVTYRLTGGRFGENLLAFCCAKWLSIKYNIPLLYKPFVYSEQLMLHDTNLLYSENMSDYAQEKSLSNEQSLHTSTNTLYVVYYFRSRLADLHSANEPDVFKQENAACLRELKKVVQSRIPLPTIAVPAGTISVALHVRKGGGFDRPLLTEQKNRINSIKKMRSKYEDLTFPLKFPPDQFYIEQLHYLATQFPDDQLYVHIFTDDPNPARLVEKYSTALHNPHITFGYRQSGNAHNAHVLEDFFAMMNFDCLIRPDSSFSRAAELLGNHRMVIYPRAAKWHHNQLLISDIRVRTIARGKD